MGHAMKAVYWTREYDPAAGTPGMIELLDVAKPVVKEPDDVLIHVVYASICGSDAHYIKDDILKVVFHAPAPIGHEISGIVEDLGGAAEAKGLKRGDWVTGNFVLECGHCAACRSGKRQFCENPRPNGAGQAEYIVWKADQIYKIPDGVSLLEASLIEPFAIAVEATERGGLDVGRTVFTLGAGCIGQMMIQLAAKTGASLVGASVRTSSKRAIARKMGADFAVNPNTENLVKTALDRTNGQGYDVVFETSGSLECVQQALQIVKSGGTVVFVGYYPPSSFLKVPLFEQMIFRELTLKGAQLAQNSWIQSLKLFPKMDLKPIISKVYPLEECRKAYQDLVKGESLKLILQCSDDPEARY